MKKEGGENRDRRVGLMSSLGSRPIHARTSPPWHGDIAGPLGHSLSEVRRNPECNSVGGAVSRIQACHHTAACGQPMSYLRCHPSPFKALQSNPGNIA